MHNYQKQYQEDAVKALFTTWFNTSTPFDYDKYGKHITVDTLTFHINQRKEAHETFNEARNKVINENKVNREALVSDLKKYVDEKKIFKTRKSGKGWMAVDKVTGEFRSHYAKVWADVEKYVPRVMVGVPVIPERTIITYQGVSLTVNTMASNKVERSVGDFLEAMTSTIKKHVASVVQSNVKLSKAIEYCENNKLDVSWCVGVEDYVKVANDFGKEQYFESMKGEEIDVTHGDGDDCEWTVGEHRCSCGNNRYYLEVEGNFMEGYYGYGQWC